jgi:rRNA maturation endonuclease Nob1
VSGSVSKRWDYYQCINPECGNAVEAKHNPKMCEICGGPVTKRPNDNAQYDFQKQEWINSSEDGDD